MAVFFPMCPVVLGAVVGHLSVTGLVAASAIAGVFVPLARAMKVACGDTELQIRNMFMSHSIPLTDIVEVGLSPPLAPGHTSILEVTMTSGRIFPAAGVSVWSDSLTLRRRFSNRKSLAAIERATTFFQECGLKFRWPPR